MTPPSFDIYPYVGPLPLRFGTPRRDVPALFGLAARPTKNGDRFGSHRVGYDGGDEVAEVSFVPREVTLSFLEKRLWDSERIEDPIPTLLDHDPAPVEFLGFLIFAKIGVTCAGFHDDDRSQRSINVFRRGIWDKFIPEAKAPDLSRYRI